MRKIKLPIYFKLALFTLLVTGLSLSAFVFYAVELFKSDKVSYVYEAVDDFNEKITEQYLNKKLVALKSLKQIESLNYDTSFIFNYLKQNPEIHSYFEISSNKVNKIVSLHGNSKSDFIKSFSDKLKSISGEKNKEFLVVDDFVFIFSKYDNDSKTIGLVSSINDFLVKPDSSLYVTEFLFLKNSKVGIQEKIKNHLLTKKIVSQTFFISDTDDYIVSARNLSEEIFILTMTNNAKALSASTTLKNNSIYFGVLVAGIVMILVLVFSQLVTGPINKLAILVNEFLSSNFKVRSQIKTSDEIGFLANSFNKMADDINSYIVEMEHKAKIEQELQTANIVQSQFFPQNVFENNHCSVAGFYQSASECGGDWWGVFENKQTTVVILADVTGHGTPAALMTAVLHSSLNSLEYLSRFDQQFIRSSAKIMGFLNDSFLKSTNKLNATAFVMCLNHGSGIVNYTNASHNPPYYLPLGSGKIDKSSLKPLLGEIGLRLGEQKAFQYEEVELSVKTKDKIILYTDGILEGVNVDKKVFGQRNFIKQILKLQHLSVQELGRDLMDNFYSFTQNEPLEDDITFVSFEMKGKPKFLTINLNDDNIKEIKDLNFVEDLATSNVLYGNALIDTLEKIPSNIKMLIPLEHYKQFGISKIPVNGNKILEIKFKKESASEVIEQISKKLDNFDFEGAFGDLPRYLLTVCSELVRNGINLNMNDICEEVSKEVHLEVYEGQDNFFVKVSDGYGLLKSQDISRRLKEVAKNGTYERKTLGAGLGLFMVINSVNTIEFNVDSGICTEVICRINKYKRLKQFKEKQTAIFFNKRENECPV
jgi:sigma-B regulation protein RsbU (phosphoserine phosphatase)